MTPELANIQERRLFAFLVTPHILFDYAHALAFAGERVGIYPVTDIVAGVAAELARLEWSNGLEVSGIHWEATDDGPDPKITLGLVGVDGEMKNRLRVFATERALPVPYGGFDGLLRYALGKRSDFGDGGDKGLEDVLRTALESVENQLESEKGHLKTLLEEGPAN